MPTTKVKDYNHIRTVRTRQPIYPSPNRTSFQLFPIKGCQTPIFEQGSLDSTISDVGSYIFSQKYKLCTFVYRLSTSKPTFCQEKVRCSSSAARVLREVRINPCTDRSWVAVQHPRPSFSLHKQALISLRKVPSRNRVISRQTRLRLGFPKS